MQEPYGKARRQPWLAPCSVERNEDLEVGFTALGLKRREQIVHAWVVAHGNNDRNFHELLSAAGAGRLWRRKKRVITATSIE